MSWQDSTVPSSRRTRAPYLLREIASKFLINQPGNRQDRLFRDRRKTRSPLSLRQNSIGIVSRRRLSAARRDTHEPCVGRVRFRIPAGVLPGPGQEAEPAAGRDGDECAGLLRVSFRPEAVDVEIPLGAPLRRAALVDRAAALADFAHAEHVDSGVVQRQADPFRQREQRH